MAAIPITYNLRSLMVRRTTSLMTAFGVALVVMVVVILLSFVSGLRARGHTDRARPVLSLLTHNDLQPHRAVPGEHQRGLQHELAHSVAPNLATSAQHEIQEPRTREQDRPHRRVIGQPRIVL